MTDSTSPITFIDPQPQPGDEDRVWFCIPSSGTGLYAVTRTSCSCPAGTHRKESVCRHRKHLLECLEEGREAV